MNREDFLKTKDEDLVTVRVISADGEFNRLINMIPAGDGGSFQALDVDLRGVEEGMLVRLPEGARATIKSVNASKGNTGVSTVVFHRGAGSNPQTSAPAA